MTCPHFPRCGGCQLLDQPYDSQIEQKQRVLDSLFSFVTGLKMAPIIACREPWYYRCKVQLPFGQKKQGRTAMVTLGCYARNSHEVVDQRVCHIQDKDLSIIAWTVREWATKSRLSVYSEAKHEGFLRHLLLRKASGSGEVLVGLITNGEKPAGSRRLAATLLSMISEKYPCGKIPVVGIVQNVNLRQTNIVLGDREFTWWGRPLIFETIGTFSFKLGLSTFFQVNPSQTERLYDVVRQGISQGPAVLDCYSGVGSISLFVSKKSRIVTAIEENGASIAAAKKALQFNGVRNVRFVRGDAAALFPLMANEGYEVAIFDPPRKGLERSMITALDASDLRRIIYVSCNPESLARDVLALIQGWNLVSLQGVDMFPHTPHIECVAMLDRKA